MSSGRALHLRCFLEGIEVEIISCSVSATLNGGPASAHIELPDSEKGFELLPRTIVHVFFYDDLNGTNLEEPTYLKDKASRTSSSYKLLFSGELFSVFHNKTAYGNRSLSIMALDMSNVLDTNYVFQVGYSDTAGILGRGDQASAQFLAGKSIGTNPFDNIINSPQEVIRHLSTKSALSPLHSRRTSKLGGLFSIFELLLGVQGHAMGMNLWTTIHESMTRLLDSIDSDDGTTAKQLFDNTVFTQWIQNTVGSQAPSMS